jgi:hypothetical protein
MNSEFRVNTDSGNGKMVTLIAREYDSDPVVCLWSGFEWTRQNI